MCQNFQAEMSACQRIVVSCLSGVIIRLPSCFSYDRDNYILLIMWVLLSVYLPEIGCRLSIKVCGYDLFSSDKKAICRSKMQILLAYFLIKFSKSDNLFGFSFEINR